jgi:hypothetical protein
MTPSLLCPPLGCAKENLKSQGNITIEPLPPQKQFSSRLCWMMVEPGSSLSQTMAQSAPLTAGNTLFSVASYIHLCCNTDIHCTTHTHTHTHTHKQTHTHTHTHIHTHTLVGCCASPPHGWKVESTIWIIINKLYVVCSASCPQY